MDKSKTASIELVKTILDHLREPRVLNSHPWAANLGSTPRPGSSTQMPGERLIEILTVQFSKLKPSGPPRQGKRLDTRWGVFGILAARYFAPLVLGKPFPASVREAWDSLDEAILVFVHDKPDGGSDEERGRYRFAGNEITAAPISTLSDWQHRGIEQLAELMSLEISRMKSTTSRKEDVRSRWKQAGMALAGLTLALAVFFSVEAWVFYKRALTLEEHINSLSRSFNPPPTLKQIPELTIRVHDLSIELEEFHQDVEPYLWLAPYLEWMPKYGGTISQAQGILALAQHLTNAAEEGLSAISPAIETAVNNDQPLDVLDLVLQLQEVAPKLMNAQLELAQAQAARERIDVQRLTPGLKKIVLEHVDPLMNSITNTVSLEDALTLVQIAPKLLGSGKVGPQTYLVLMQNEDELRPTGGFLTAVGSTVIKDGKLISIDIDSSDLVDDLHKPFPVPPWQFKEFMNIEMLLFRDSNWFTDFPTTVSWAEYFYSYSRASSADGVIALDMHVIVRLLETLGPVRVMNVEYPITSENVMEYMRSAEESRPSGVKGKWDRKQFIGELSQPILEKILNARGQTWKKLVPVLLELLDEHHILLQFDDEQATALLLRRAWDGAVRIPANSDFIMQVDTNMGYNKSNAVMVTNLEYNVDLTNPVLPAGDLSVRQINHSKVDLPCEPMATRRLLSRETFPGEIPEPVYNMDECHWGYLRIYTPAGTKLLHSNPSQIPEEATMLGESIPARTDDLGSEDIPGAQVFGMMIITPAQGSTETEFGYVLPPEVVTQDEVTGSWTYRLKVQKQPGTLAVPFNLRLRLPAEARIENANIPLARDAGVWKAELDLRRDLLIEVRYSLR